MGGSDPIREALKRAFPEEKDHPADFEEVAAMRVTCLRMEGSL